MYWVKKMHIKVSIRGEDSQGVWKVKHRKQDNVLSTTASLDC